MLTADLNFSPSKLSLKTPMLWGKHEPPAMQVMGLQIGRAWPSILEFVQLSDPQLQRGLCWTEASMVSNWVTSSRIHCSDEE